MKNISVISNSKKDTDFIYTNQVIKILQNFECRYHISEMFNIDMDFFPEMIICLGGDGTIMNVSRSAAVYNIPILGINLGRVGYLAELECNEIWMIEKIFDNDFILESRMMLELKNNNINIDEKRTIGMNDIVFSHGVLSKMAQFELRCNGNVVNHYRADGLIVATPTGSTAYSMSAGGPVIDPKLDCLCVTPICSHSLSAKPLIFSPQSVLEIINKCKNEADMYATIDGKENCILKYNDSSAILKSDVTTKLIRMKKDGFYNILNKKMSDN